MHCYEIDASIWRSVILTCTQDGVKTDLEWGCNRSRVFFLLLHIIVGDGVLSQVWDGTLATCACATHVSSQRFDVNRIRKRWRISRVIMYKAVYHGLCMAMLVLDSFGAQFLTGFARTTIPSWWSAPRPAFQKQGSLQLRKVAACQTMWIRRLKRMEPTMVPLHGINWECKWDTDKMYI